MTTRETVSNSWKTRHGIEIDLIVFTRSNGQEDIDTKTGGRNSCHWRSSSRRIKHAKEGCAEERVLLVGIAVEEHWMLCRAQQIGSWTSELGV